MFVQKYFPARNRKGFTIIELMIALAIIGVALIAIVGKGLVTRDNSKVQTEIGNLQAISNSVHNTLGATGSYNGLTLQSVINAGGFPTQMFVNGIPQDSWGGATAIQVTTIGTGGFDIIYPAVPQSSCVALVSQSLTTFAHIKIQSTSNPTTAWTGAAISAACTPGNNSITFNAL